MWQSSDTASDVVGYPIVDNDDLSMDPAYRDLQDRGPFSAQLAYGEPVWVVTRYEDAKTVYGDRRFSKALGVGRDRPRMHEMAVPDDPTLLANMDPPDHTRVRRLASTAFSPARIRDMAGWIEGMTSTLLDDLVAGGPGSDFMARFAWKLPLQVITGILGVDEEHIPTFKTWVDELTGVDSRREQRTEAHHRMTAFIRGLIAERRERSTDDLLSALVQARDDDDRLGEDELVNLAMTLFLGGFETTAAQLGSTVYVLLADRNLWQELVDDRDTLPAAMEELWRWIPSFRHGRPMIRWASEDVELSAGVVVPAGDPVLAEHQIANRDESAFPDGWEVDFHRSEPQPHLSLAWGPHRCMGAHLANLEVEVALTAMLERFPSLALALAPEDVEWSHTTFLRSASALPLAW
jgi:cytochrome P450